LSYEPGVRHLSLEGARGFIAVEVRVTFSRPLTGDVRVEITENDMRKHVLLFGATAERSKAVFSDEAGRELSRRQIARGSSVGVRVNDPGGHAAGSAVAVDVIGVRMTAIAGP
jgi:hypothetical protein